MVESSVCRICTPTQPESLFTKFSPGSSPRSSSSSPEFYDPIPIVNGTRPRSTGDRDANGDANGVMSDKNVGSGSRRRPRPPLPSAQPQVPSPNPSENRPLMGFPYAPPNPQYSQQIGYPYTISAHPMAHPYAFPPYHHPVATESNMRSHIYPTMLQPLPAYPYEASSSFPGSRTTPMYQSPPASTPPSRTHSYSGPFQSLQYPSSTTYSYPQQPFSPAPMFQSQYPHPSYGQHYTPTAEPEPQGTWYYLPHTPVSAPQPSYESGRSFQTHFPTLSYPHPGRSETDAVVYNHPPPSSPATAAQFRYSESADSSSRPGGRQSPSPDLLRSSMVRKSYHPNPPAHRSEWVMWAGNVPSDATHDELWRVFNQPQPPPDSTPPVASGSQQDNSSTTGVLSIFLISRSSCAFINYTTEPLLLEAIKRFNGVPLRANDPRCPRLVCRMRKMDDDLRAGVGGQRGLGMHTRWIKERKEREQQHSPDPSSPSGSLASISERMTAAISTLSISSDALQLGPQQERRGVHAKQSSSSESHASTNSGFLARHFPKRYFILKSLTQYDLDLSVERGLWATQKHNEEILDQAFRTSKDVYLIFGVNRSGEFYGYARMAGSVHRGEQRVSWASRSPQSSASRSPRSTLLSRGGSSSRGADSFFSPSDSRFVDNSPLPIEANFASSDGGALRHSAPALMGGPYRLSTKLSLDEKFSLDQGMTKAAAKKGFQLDSDAPQRAARQVEVVGSSPMAGPALQSVQEVEERDVSHPPVVVEGEEETGVQQQQQQQRAVPEEEEEREREAWGDSFAIEWISSVKLPFQRTRHLRNPWNHDREVKVSRDGTELEPTVGERLLGEWEEYAKEVVVQSATAVGMERPVVVGKKSKSTGAAGGSGF